MSVEFIAPPEPVVIMAAEAMYARRRARLIATGTLDPHDGPEWETLTSEQKGKWVEMALPWVEVIMPLAREWVEAERVIARLTAEGGVTYG